MRRFPLNREVGPSRRRPAAAWLSSAAVAAVVALYAGSILAQQQGRQQIQIQANQIQRAQRIEPASAPTTGGASVETATDALGLIQRANADLKDGQLERAVRREGRSCLGILFASALLPERAPVGALSTTTFFGGVRDPAKLEAVVERYLLSSIGDEAAYRLACHWIDRGRFADAATLLQRLLRIYPDPTVDRPAVMVRLALAHGRSGSTGARDRIFDRLAEAGVEKATLARLRSAAGRSGRPPAAEGWPMTGGGADRLGTMPAMDPASREVPQELWAKLWSHRAPGTTDQLVSALQSSIHRNYTLMTSRASMTRRSPKPRATPITNRAKPCMIATSLRCTCP